MPHIDQSSLESFSAALLTAAGMDADKAGVTARVLVEGDMIGHATHGVGLLPWYLDALGDGTMRGSGDHEVVSDRGAAFVWDGRLLPGAWLLTRALELAAERVRQFGVVTIAIRNSHHTCALSAYMRELTENGLIVQISCSNPAASRVAPYGGTKPLLTPNPIAAGFPTSGDPVLIDVSSSITTTTMTQSLAKTGERFPEAWALTASGEPTDDPRAVTEGGGSLLPLGGVLKGHKGYGLGLMVELLGQGLSGKGRANTAPGPLAQSVFLQVIDPEAFAGLEAFRQQSDWLVDACRSNPPAPGKKGRVRVPGDAAANKRRQALDRGVPVSDAAWSKIAQRAATMGIAVPRCAVEEEKIG
jgi:LDH2 family malate/lactate/ureidoglycolate dehydrogenase